jgi:hypothetical protein
MVNKEVLKYKNHLENCFKYIADSDFINEKCSYISGNAKNIFSRLKNSSDKKIFFKIDPAWIIPLYGDDNFKNSSTCFLLTGCMDLEEKISKYSYSATILSSSNMTQPETTINTSCCDLVHYNEDRVIRRFHLDLDVGSTSITEPKSHLHYGGRILEEELQAFPKLHYCIDSKIGTPRFPHPPLDFILLFDLLLRQFNTTIDKKFVEDRYWKKLVKNSENFRLKQYYDSILHYFSDEPIDKTLLELMSSTDFKV